MSGLLTLMRRTNGSSAVEFALLAPVFFACVFSMIGYAIYLSASASVQNMTAEAARAAVAGLSAQERQQLAERAIAAGSKDLAFINPDKVKVTITGQDTDRYTIQVSYDASEMPIWSMFTYALPSTKSISRSAVMRVGGSL